MKTVSLDTKPQTRGMIRKGHGAGLIEKMEVDVGFTKLIFFRIKK